MSSSLPINFFSEDISFTLKEKIHIRNWLKQAIRAENKKLKEITFIFCSDNYLLEINRQYLRHDTFTDIVTFDNSETEEYITGDIFISIERVRENASKYAVNERDELHRVMIHGTLHLIGYTDKKASEKALMTKKEDEYLGLRGF
ncbi:MAG: rRNA maturation RNase YbeY [Pyrinomonadaceae bacterium]|nr:rRNA maturation RNase YbeY [Sphingobacteriaceae bacterium]